ncbi:hypothetical protein Tco_1503766 [Tanacetum coccineum]
MNSPENHEWEYLLDIDDFDLQLSALLRLSNSSNTSLLQTQEMYVDEKATRIIPGPVGIFQTDRIHKLNNFNDAPTQEYVRKLIDDVSEADDFKRRSWITALEFINDNEEIGVGVLAISRATSRRENLRKFKEQGGTYDRDQHLMGTALDSGPLLLLLRLLRGEDLDKAKSIMKLNTYKKYTFIAKVKLDRK